MTSSPEAVLVSYRLGGSDGVAVEAAKWEWALRELGFWVRRVAGEFGTLRPDDTWLPFLAIEPVAGAVSDAGALAASIAGADLVVVENICSLPLNPTAAQVTRTVIERHRGRVCFHHHDFPWERPHLADIEGFPFDRPNSVHITISEHGRNELHARGIEATYIHNSFDFDTWPGERDATRHALPVAPEDVLLVQPTRAIPRKNVGGGLRFAEALGERIGRPIVYWVTGPAEDGYGHDFAALVDTAGFPIRVGRAQTPADAYAAADLVVFPSTWEGFGNPVVESVAARRMVAVGWYPVLDEIIAGLSLLSVDKPDDAAAWLTEPDTTVLDANFRIARDRFAIEHLPRRLAAAFSAVGWDPW